MRALALLTAALLLSAGTPAIAQQNSSPLLPDLEDEVMCPTCGTTLALSESPQASQIRALIRNLEADGLDKQEIKDALVAEYGPEVLSTPEASGFDLAAWIVPGAALLLAAGAIGVGAHRWRTRGADGGAPAPGPAAIDPAEEERLRADLRSYEL